MSASRTRSRKEARDLVDAAINSAGQVYAKGSDAYILCIQGNLQTAIEGLLARHEPPRAQPGCRLVTVPFGQSEAVVELEGHETHTELLNVWVAGQDITDGLCDETQLRLHEAADAEIEAEAKQVLIDTGLARIELAEVMA